MKKLCFITTTSLTLKTFVLDTAAYLHEHGEYEITFICDTDDSLPALLPPYIRYLPVPMKRGMHLDGLRTIRELRRIFRRERFDLVQYATPNAALYASIAARQAGVPLRVYCQWGIRYVGMQGGMRRLFRSLERSVCRRSTHIRAVSPKNRQFSIEERLYPADKAVVLGQGGTIGVDLSLYSLDRKAEWRQSVREQYGLLKTVVFGFVGRISRDKGCGELLLAFRRLAAEYPQARLLFIGDREAETGIDPELFDWALDSGQVLFTGPIDKSQLCRMYAAIDIYVHPTYREGFGMVLQEAGAMACAILTTAIPGASEVMEQDVSCLLVPPRDARELEGQMRRLLADPALRERLGEAARRRVESCFDRRDMLRRQWQDYQTLLREGEV